MPASFEELERNRVVGRAEEADRERARHDRGRDQARGREVIVGAEPEREHDERDEHEGGNDAPGTGATFADE